MKLTPMVVETNELHEVVNRLDNFMHCRALFHQSNDIDALQMVAESPNSLMILVSRGYVKMK